MQERIIDLKAQHQNLERALDEEPTKSHPDDYQIASIKKQKLAIKDEIADLELKPKGAIVRHGPDTALQ